MSEETPPSEEQYPLPPTSIWPHIAKIAITEDKPIMLDYWSESLEKKVLIGIRENEEKLLVKNALLLLVKIFIPPPAPDN